MRYPRFLTGLWLLLILAGSSWSALAVIRVACVGDSITYGSGIEGRESNSYPAVLQRLLGDQYEVRNFGVSGATLLKKGDKPYWTLPAYAEARRFQPDIVILLLGTNDSKPQNRTHAEELSQNLAELLSVFRTNSPAKLFVGVPPPIFQSRWGINDSILTEKIIPPLLRTAGAERVPVIDFHAAMAAQPELFPDGIHPNAAGAALMAKTVATRLSGLTPPPPAATGRFLYVAVPGIRNYLEYGGHGVLVFDIEAGHKFVRRIKTSGVDTTGRALNVKGVCASASTGRLYITTPRTMQCIDLLTDQLLWENAYPGGCDRMSISPDGKTIYVPSFEGAHWNVVDAISGERIAKVTPNSGAHNTLYGRDGKSVYLAGLRSPWLTVAETGTHTSNRSVGPFSAPIRPFTVNRAQTLSYCCVNELLGFEVGDIASGTVVHQVKVSGFAQGTVKRHGCPSHGIGLTPDEKELWLCDGANSRMHVFDATVQPPRQIASIAVRDQPGWITFSLDGRHGYPSSGDVVEVATHKIVAQLTDETGAAVGSEKLLEIDFKEGRPIRAGDQFGFGLGDVQAK